MTVPEGKGKGSRIYWNPPQLPVEAKKPPVIQRGLSFQEVREKFAKPAPFDSSTKILLKRREEPQKSSEETDSSEREQKTPTHRRQRSISMSIPSPAQVKKANSISMENLGDSSQTKLTTSSESTQVKVRNKKDKEKEKGGEKTSISEKEAGLETELVFKEGMKGFALPSNFYRIVTDVFADLFVDRGDEKEKESSIEAEEEGSHPGRKIAGKLPRSNTFGKNLPPLEKAQDIPLSPRSSIAAELKEEGNGSKRRIIPALGTMFKRISKENLLHPFTPHSPRQNEGKMAEELDPVEFPLEIGFDFNEVKKVTHKHENKFNKSLKKELKHQLDEKFKGQCIDELMNIRVNAFIDQEIEKQVERESPHPMGFHSNLTPRTKELFNALQKNGILWSPITERMLFVRKHLVDFMRERGFYSDFAYVCFNFMNRFLSIKNEESLAVIEEEKEPNGRFSNLSQLKQVIAFLEDKNKSAENKIIKNLIWALVGGEAVLKKILAILSKWADSDSIKKDFLLRVKGIREKNLDRLYIPYVRHHWIESEESSLPMANINKIDVLETWTRGNAFLPKDFRVNDVPVNVNDLIFTDGDFHTRLVKQLSEIRKNEGQRAEVQSDVKEIKSKKQRLKEAKRTAKKRRLDAMRRSPLVQCVFDGISIPCFKPKFAKKDPPAIFVIDWCSLIINSPDFAKQFVYNGHSQEMSGDHDVERFNHLFAFAALSEDHLCDQSHFIENCLIETFKLGIYCSKDEHYYHLIESLDKISEPDSKRECLIEFITHELNQNDLKLKSKDEGAINELLNAFELAESPFNKRQLILKFIFRKMGITVNEEIEYQKQILKSFQKKLRKDFCQMLLEKDYRRILFGNLLQLFYTNGFDPSVKDDEIPRILENVLSCQEPEGDAATKRAWDLLRFCSFGSWGKGDKYARALYTKLWTPNPLNDKDIKKLEESQEPVLIYRAAHEKGFKCHLHFDEGTFKVTQYRPQGVYLKLEPFKMNSSAVDEQDCKMELTFKWEVFEPIEEQKGILSIHSYEMTKNTDPFLKEYLLDALVNYAYIPADQSDQSEVSYI